MDFKRVENYNNLMKILLTEIMHKKNLSVRQVSLMTGLSKSAIQKIMDESSNPTMNTMERLAIGLKVRIVDLFESGYK